MRSVPLQTGWRDWEHEACDGGLVVAAALTIVVAIERSPVHTADGVLTGADQPQGDDALGIEIHQIVRILDGSHDEVQTRVTGLNGEFGVGVVLGLEEDVRAGDDGAPPKRG